MPKILVIDDRTGGPEFFSTLLSARGYAVLTARDAAEGLRMAREEAPDLVIGDITPPRAEGGALLRLLRADGRMAAVPAILYAVPGTQGLSPLTEPGLKAGGGPVRLLEKPDEPEVVLAAVAAILEEASLAGAAAASRGSRRRILAERVAAEFSRLEEAVAAAGGGKRAPWRSFGLTAREADALHLLMQGHDHKAIAAALGVAYLTARLDLQGAFTKMGARDELDAVRIARSTGLGAKAAETKAGAAGG